MVLRSNFYNTNKSNINILIYNLMKKNMFGTYGPIIWWMVRFNRVRAINMTIFS